MKAPTLHCLSLPSGTVTWTIGWSSLSHFTIGDSDMNDWLVILITLYHREQWHERLAGHPYHTLPSGTVTWTIGWSSLSHFTIGNNDMNDWLVILITLYHRGQWHERLAGHPYHTLPSGTVTWTIGWSSLTHFTIGNSDMNDWLVILNTLYHREQWHERLAGHPYHTLPSGTVTCTIGWSSLSHFTIGDSDMYDWLVILITLYHRGQWHERLAGHPYHTLPSGTVTCTIGWSSLSHFTIGDSDMNDWLVILITLYHRGQWHERLAGHLYHTLPSGTVTWTIGWSSLSHFTIENSDMYDWLVILITLYHRGQWHERLAGHPYHTLPSGTVTWTIGWSSLSHFTIGNSDMNDWLVILITLYHREQWHERLAGHPYHTLPSGTVTWTIGWSSLSHFTIGNSDMNDWLVILITLYHREQWHERLAGHPYHTLPSGTVTWTIGWSSLSHFTIGDSDMYDWLVILITLYHREQWHERLAGHPYHTLPSGTVTCTIGWSSLSHFTIGDSDMNDWLVILITLYHREQWHERLAGHPYHTFPSGTVTCTIGWSSLSHFTIGDSDMNDWLVILITLYHWEQWHERLAGHPYHTLPSGTVTCTIGWSSLSHFTIGNSDMYDWLVILNTLYHREQWHERLAGHPYHTLPSGTVTWTIGWSSLSHFTIGDSDMNDWLVILITLSHREQWHERLAGHPYHTFPSGTVTWTIGWSSLSHFTIENSDMYDWLVILITLYHWGQWHVRLAGHPYHTLPSGTVTWTIGWSSLSHFTIGNSDMYDWLVILNILYHREQWHERLAGHPYHTLPSGTVTWTIGWSSLSHFTIGNSDMYDWLVILITLYHRGQWHERLAGHPYHTLPSGTVTWTIGWSSLSQWSKFETFYMTRG